MRDGFNMHHSDLQEFLLAPIWDEKNGVPLSILSALARLGMDPWGEAARLANMPRSGAALALAAILARLPRNDPGQPDYARLSQDLVQFLPEGGSTPAIDRQGANRPGSGNIAVGGKIVSIKNLGLALAVVTVFIVLQVTGWLF
jgi:hypothetical protein